MKYITATLGFLFTQDFAQVLLIHKKHPEWQAGKINGIGGKCEHGEGDEECISREVREETNLVVHTSQWKTVTALEWDVWQVTVFAAIYSGSTGDALSLTDEKVEWFPVAQLPKNVMSNLRWLIPLAVDQLTNEQPPVVEAVRYPT